MPSNLDVLEIFYDNDHTKSWERIEKNPELKGKFSIQQARIWDQILSVSEKIKEELQRQEDEFFAARPFLAEKNLLYLRQHSSANMSIKSSPQDDSLLKGLIGELNNLWAEWEEEHVKTYFNNSRRAVQERFQEDVEEALRQDDKKGV